MALVKFADKRRSWQHVQLDLLYTIDRPWLVLHAELSSRCPERVSIFIFDYRDPRSRSVSLIYQFAGSLRILRTRNESTVNVETLFASLPNYVKKDLGTRASKKRVSWIRRVDENSFVRSTNGSTTRVRPSRFQRRTADYVSFCSSGSFRTKEHASRGGRLIRKQRESVYSRLRSVPT